MALLEKCIGLDADFRKALDIGLIWEGNYWDDQDVHDCCDVDWETLEILVRKISRAFDLPTVPTANGEVESRKVLIFLPKVMQLPLTILAAYRAGMVGILMNPQTTKNAILESTILAEKPKMLVTVDAFWQAQELIEVKRRIEHLHGMDDVQLLVIRHVAPNPGVPPPKKHYPARRPSYRTTLDLRDGRDWEWSTVMARITVDRVRDRGRKVETDNSEFQWSEEDVVMKVVDEQGTCHPITNSALFSSLQSRASGLATKFDNAMGIENIMVLNFPRHLDSLTDLLVPWFMGKTLTLYEGPADYPDSSRLSQIVSKHKVNALIGGSVEIPNPEYLKFFATPSLKFSEFPGIF